MQDQREIDRAFRTICRRENLRHVDWPLLCACAVMNLTIVVVLAISMRL